MCRQLQIGVLLLVKKSENTKVFLYIHRYLKDKGENG